MTDVDTVTSDARAALGRFDLSGRRALVVGGNKGLGRAMALALAGAGAEVCVAGRGPEGLSETSAEISAMGRKGSSFAADVADEASVEALMAHMDGVHGGIDILVNSQGTVYLHPAVDFDMGEWQRVMDVNLKSLVLTCKHAGRRMVAKGRGKIINIASVRAFQGRAKDLAYSTSKGAVVQLTRSLAIEWGPFGVNVNGIAPVFTLTAISAPVLADTAIRDWVLGRIPMKRLGALDDLFGPVIFLASDASNFVNGHTLPVDGGWLGA